MKQRMVKSLASLSGSFHKDAQVFHDLFLSRKTTESIRAEYVFQVFLGLGEMGAVGIEVAIHHNFKQATKIIKKVYLCTQNNALIKMKRFLLIILFTTFVYGGFAQRGSLHVNQDSRIERLMRRQRDVYAANNTMPGFRVQIFMEIGNEAVDHAAVTKKRFEDKFPELPVYLSYEQPYYRLRVGDFRNRVEAEKYLRLIKPQFGLAFVTADIINPPQKMEPVDLEALEDNGEETGEGFPD